MSGSEKRQFRRGGNESRNSLRDNGRSLEILHAPEGRGGAAVPLVGSRSGRKCVKKR